MVRRLFKSSQGQTAVEYLLMVVVVVSIGMAFFRKMDEYILQNPDGLIAKPLNSYKRMLTGGGNGNGAYRRFTVRKAPSRR